MSPRNEPTQSRLKEAHRLKRLRTTLELTQTELAKEFRVAQGAVAQWENGVRTIPGPVLKLIEAYESGAIKPSSKRH
jgi:DNA-binding transcriptional regulator YiaG